MAKYSSVEKAEKALRMLRETYTGEINGYKIEDGNLFHERKTYECIYFQFPNDDDEVEV